MILKQVYISNFKVLKDITVDFSCSKPLTVISGSHRSGKTTFINLINVLLKEFFGKHFDNHKTFFIGYVNEGVLAKFTLVNEQNEEVKIEFSIIPYTLEYPDNSCITHTPLDDKFTFYCKASIPISQLKKKLSVSYLTVLNSTFLLWELVEFLRLPSNKTMFLKDINCYSDVTIDEHEDNVFFNCIYNKKSINLHDLSSSEINLIYTYVLIKTANSKIFLIDTTTDININIDSLKEVLNWSNGGQFIIATNNDYLDNDISKVAILPNPS